MSRLVTAEDANAAIELIQYAYFKKVLEKEKKKRRREGHSESEDDDDGDDNNQRSKKSRTAVRVSISFRLEVTKNFKSFLRDLKLVMSQRKS